MLKKVSITNFKSIKRLEFETRRVNVFIGEPNTGKSNVLEALAVFCEGVYAAPEILRGVLRFVTLADLFYDRELTETVEVRLDELPWTLRFEKGTFKIEAPLVAQNGASILPSRTPPSLSLNHSGSLASPPKTPSSTPGLANPLFCNSLQAVHRLRYYRYQSLPNFSRSEYGVLEPPHGANLAAVLTTNKSLRRLVSDLFRERGFRLIISPEKNELLLAKEVEDQLYQFSYPTVSETLRRIVFYMAVFETNQDAVLLLDEPEANTFPFYTTYLAERIALDESNQFFLTTHNPYVLSSLVAKTPAKDLAVFVTTMPNYQTVLHPVGREGLSRILEYGPDAFLNLERLLAP